MIHRGNHAMYVRLTTRRPKLQRRGAAMVEFAFVLPLLILFFVASIELFRLSQIRHAADSAAYEACRHVIVPGATQAEAVSEANRLLKVLGITNAAIAISPSTITEATPEVTVFVNIPATGNTWIVPRFSQNVVVNASSTLLTERVAAVQAAGIPKP
jgi:Flp pilus assembly protein TadG